MRDSTFIEEIIERGEKAHEWVRKELGHLSYDQLNWKPAAEQWSIGQCLDHLIVSDMLYFPDLRLIAEKKYTMNYWERFSPFSGLFGRMLITQIQEKPKKKYRTPQHFKPESGNIDGVLLERYHKHLDTFLEYMALFRKIDIDKIRISSPASPLVTYSLRHALQLIIQHQYRHLNQALRVKEHKQFPL